MPAQRSLDLWCRLLVPSQLSPATFLAERTTNKGEELTTNKGEEKQMQNQDKNISASQFAASGTLLGTAGELASWSSKRRCCRSSSRSLNID